jgi:hypothetical protein
VDGQQISSGALMSRTDADNSVTEIYGYDRLGRTTSVVQSINTVANRNTTYSYDDTNLTVTARGDKRQYNDQLLSTTTHYDALGRVNLAVDAAGNRTEKAYRFGTNVSYELTSNPYAPLRSTTTPWVGVWQRVIPWDERSA